MDSKLQEYINWCCDKYLSYRPRTVYEMKTYIQRKLVKRGVKDPDQQRQYIESKIEELVQDGIVDDKAFAQWYVDEKLYFKPRGKQRLRYELRQKGVSSDIIENILSSLNISESSIAVQLLEQWHIDLDEKTADEKQKLIQKLQRKGFSYSDITSAFEEYSKKE